MASEDMIVIPTEKGLEGFDFDDAHTVELIHWAEESQEKDQRMTLRAALGKYKSAVFWAMLLSTSLIMEGFDLVIINSFYGQTQFKNKFGHYNPTTGQKSISAPWTSGLSNSSAVGQLFGLLVNSWAQDRFGCRPTMMFFMAWISVMFFILVFAPSLSVLAFGEAMCGVGFGVFQTLSTSYAVEVVPTVLRSYVTAYVCMCWGAGILLSSGVARVAITINSDWAWRLPFVLQWIWPLPLFIGAYLAPESPWNSVRRDKLEEARTNLRRLRKDAADRDAEVELALAYIVHTTQLERAETDGASFLDCFRGTNLRRTEINCVIWAAQILCGNAILGYVIIFLEAAGFSEVQAFNTNIGLSACYIVGGIICWFLFPHFGRATLYMVGLAFMCACMITIGALGFYRSSSTDMAVGMVFVVSTLCNMITIGPVCYPIVAETPSGKLRYKTISIGRFVYNITNIISNCITPRMVYANEWNWGAKAGLFYAGTNLLCLIWCWFRLPETHGRTFGEIDILFDNNVPARKFKYSKVEEFAHKSDEIKKTGSNVVEHREVNTS